MSDDSIRKQRLPYFRVITSLAVIIVLSVLVFFVSTRLNLAEDLVAGLSAFESFQLDELLVVSIFLVFALAVFAIQLWHILAAESREHGRLERALNHANTKLTFLNSVTRQDILDELTELSGDLEHAEKTPNILKIKAAITRIHRQIKFIKEYQDIGVSPPEWQNVLDTIMRARVGVQLGKVTVEVEIQSVEIYADRLLEKAFYYMIDNALKHGGEKLTKIRFYDRKSEDKFVIVCEDDGAGIPAEKKGALFPAEYGKHFGYGLFFIKQILYTTDITIKETSLPGKGARFEIHVPNGEYRHI